MQPDNVTETSVALGGVENAETTEVTATYAKKRNDPWKTAFIVLAGISLISAAIFYTGYARRGDLPTAVSTVDANAQPVQMGNPPTGATEQAALSVALPPAGVNAAELGVITAGGVPGGDGYDPWSNPGRFSTGTQPMGMGPMGPMGPYPVAPVTQGGQQVYMQTNPNSPFMQDGNTYIMVPAPQSNTATSANTAVKPNANTATKPAVSPTPGTSAPPAANTAPPTAQPKPDAAPAKTPAKAPAKTPAGKPRGTEDED